VVGVDLQWTRSHLSIGERALLSIAADVSNQTLDGPFAYHVRVALSHGVSNELIRDTIRFIAEFGMTKSWQALERLNGLGIARYGSNSPSGLAWFGGIAFHSDSTESIPSKSFLK
jgi:hypothetical protein